MQLVQFARKRQIPVLCCGWLRSSRIIFTNISLDHETPVICRALSLEALRQCGGLSSRNHLFFKPSIQAVGFPSDFKAFPQNLCFPNTFSHRTTPYDLVGYGRVRIPEPFLKVWNPVPEKSEGRIQQQMKQHRHVSHIPTPHELALQGEAASLQCRYLWMGNPKAPEP